MANERRWPRLARRLKGWLVLSIALALVACRATDLRLWRAGARSSGAFEVEVIRGVTYYDGPEAAGRDHQLDLFLPRGLKDYPVVVLIHGGAWIMGDNRLCGLHSSVGEMLARNGIGAVLPNYRLSPRIKHPEHVTDVARAVAWAHSHIASYGGRPDQLFLVGHSAGGHLASLLATDESYLEAEGLRAGDLKGVVTISGVYHIPAGKFQTTLGGSTPLAFRWDKIFPLRGGDGRAWPPLAWLPGIPASINVFGPAFGDDPGVRERASPLRHVRPGLPPFLIVSAENDLPTLPTEAEVFHRALVEQGSDVRLLKVKDRNHSSILYRACEAHDPVGGAILAFIRQHAHGLEQPPCPLCGGEEPLPIP